MSTLLIPHPTIGEFLCHAHVNGDVNKTLIATCMIRHLHGVEAVDCRQRKTKMDSHGTYLWWTTCRPEFCRDGRPNGAVRP